MRILTVDDSSFTLNVLLKELVAMGIGAEQIERVNSGAAALEKIAKQKYDLFILDIVMPEISGFDVLKQVTQVQPDAKVIICSGSSSNDMVSELVGMGIHAFLIKPFDSTDLAKAVRRLLFNDKEGCLVATCHVCDKEMIEVDQVNTIHFFCPNHCMQIGPLSKALVNQHELDKDYKKAKERAQGKA